MGALQQHEAPFAARIEAGLRELSAVTVHSRAAHRTPTLLLTFAEHQAAAVSAVLAQHDINAPAGSFSPMRHRDDSGSARRVVCELAWRPTTLQPK